MNPYSAPDSQTQDAPLELDVHLVLGAVIQGAVAVMGALMAIMSPFAGYMGYAQGDPAIEPLGPVGAVLVYGVLGVGCFGGVGALNGAGAVGVLRKKPWGWWCAAIAWVLLLPGGCLPLGAYGLWSLLRAHVRKGFGVPA